MQSLDVDGDGQHDLMGMTRSGESGAVALFCALSDRATDVPTFHTVSEARKRRVELASFPGSGADYGRDGQFVQDCAPSFAGWTGELDAEMPILYGDITNDLHAELIFMKKTERDGSWPEVSLVNLGRRWN